VGQFLFICTGNYYRSRCAEALFNYYASRAPVSVRAISRGLAIEAVKSTTLAAQGELSRYVREFLHARNISEEFTAPKRTGLREDDILNSQMVIALHRAEHYPMMQAKFEVWADQISYWDIPDLGRDSPPSLILPQIEQRVLDLLISLAR
jgi:protein-tyrosine phosphatase